MNPSNYISRELRHVVISRAEGLCEYCLIHEDDTFLGCKVDHVISLKHGGPTNAENLVYACVFCNRYKGSDIGSISTDAGELVRFFNPVSDRWYEHFRLDKAAITPITNIGEVTVRLLRFNIAERILERQALIVSGRYPPTAALSRLE